MLKEFRNILFGQKIIIHTDHQNILYKKLSSDRITRWRLLLEEYGPEYVHVKGTDNIVADALSRMDKDFNPDSKANIKDHSACAYICAHTMAHLIRDESCEIPDPNDLTRFKEDWIDGMFAPVVGQT
jgi:hypothetical protein